MPVGKERNTGRTGEVRKSWPFVSPLIIITSNSWSNGEVYRSTNARPIIMHRGIPQWGPNSEVHTDLQLTMDMPERYTYRSATLLDWRCDTKYQHTPLLYCSCTSTVIQGNPNWGLARADTAGGTLLPWEGSFYASSRRPRFEAWRLAGSSSGALIRAPMMLAAEGRRLCKSRRESFLSSPCLNR